MANNKIALTLTGRVVPYTRMTQASLWATRSQRYLVSQQALAYQMRADVSEKIPVFGTGVRLRLVVTFNGRYRANTDLSNLLKAVEDAAKGILWVDDCQIDSIRATRWQSLDSYMQPGEYITDVEVSEV